MKVEEMKRFSFRERLLVSEPEKALPQRALHVFNLHVEGLVTCARILRAWWPSDRSGTQSRAP
jgi:hypothetical protein